MMFDGILPNVTASQKTLDVYREIRRVCALDGLTTSQGGGVLTEEACRMRLKEELHPKRLYRTFLIKSGTCKDTGEAQIELAAQYLAEAQTVGDKLAANMSHGNGVSYAENAVMPLITDEMEYAETFPGRLHALRAYIQLGTALGSGVAGLHRQARGELRMALEEADEAARRGNGECAIVREVSYVGREYQRLTGIDVGKKAELSGSLLWVTTEAYERDLQFSRERSDDPIFVARAKARIIAGPEAKS